MIVLLENRDSFTFNLDHVLGAAGVELRVISARDYGPAAVLRLAPEAVIIGPGPGVPQDAGYSESVIRELAGVLPILGVCLGHQAIATAFGGRVVRDSEPVHGDTVMVEHDGRGVFEGLNSPLVCARYNSLIVERSSLPGVLEISALDARGEIMALRHKTLPIEGVQFHPESILALEKGGREILNNFARSLANALEVLHKH